MKASPARIHVLLFLLFLVYFSTDQRLRWLCLGILAAFVSLGINTWQRGWEWTGPLGDKRAWTISVSFSTTSRSSRTSSVSTSAAQWHNYEALAICGSLAIPTPPQYIWCWLAVHVLLEARVAMGTCHSLIACHHWQCCTHFETGGQVWWSSFCVSAPHGPSCAIQDGRGQLGLVANFTHRNGKLRWRSIALHLSLQ